MKKPEPILVADLFPPVLNRLIQLLEGLNEQDWHTPTACIGWTVLDVAHHLLLVDMSNLSRRRDKFNADADVVITNNSELVEFINNLNETWVRASSLVSPKLTIALLEFVGEQINELFANMDPFALGHPVSWAGPDPAPAWMDIAREYTERWHHQQHIRNAVGRPGLKEPKFFTPVLDAFVRAMPHTYSNVSVPDGVCVNLIINGNSGGRWTLQKERSGWSLYTGVGEDYTSQVVLDQDDAWRLFTRSTDRTEVMKRSSVSGDKDIGMKVFEMVSIIA